MNSREVAVIQGIPRRRENPSLNPGEPLEIDKRVVRHTVRYYPPVGIVGFPGSGRKTLAHRFGRVGKGPFSEEVPVKDIYGCHILENVEDESQGKCGFCILLKLYIIDPTTLSPRTPPPRLQDWNEFCCMVVVFDINDKETFYAVPRYIRVLREEFFHLRDVFFIVGNKCDLRSHERRRSQASERSIRRVATETGATYYECSAKQDIGVFDILCAVRLSSPMLRYMID